MFSPAELAGLRKMSRSAMPDRGVVTRGGGEPVFDPETGLMSPPAGTVIYRGPLRVKNASQADSTAIFGDQQITTVRHVGVLPYDAPDVHVNDVITVTRSSDPHIAKNAFRVRAVPFGSYLVDRRLGLEVVQ